ncbi:MAG: GntR family transcriptional regulator [Polaromonas sp.]|nr:GntR family transcriptional regulator [Polaromonas sp.]
MENATSTLRTVRASVRDTRRASAKPDLSDLSQNEQAYAQLKQALITLAYKPGDYLSTASLMNQLEMGRTPINHALHRLSTEGLVQIIPRKGLIVSPLSINDALELVDVRMANEALCMRLAAERITKGEIQQLKSLARDFDVAASRRHITEVMNLDCQFHDLIAVAARNHILAEILKVLHARSQRFWAISLAMEDHLSEVQIEHQAIIKALSEGDAQASVAAVEDHVLSFQRALLRTGR